MDGNRNNAFSDKLKEQVTGSFDRIRKALDLREKLLLRQLSVVVQQSHHVTFQFDNIKFVDGGAEEELVGKIRTYGKYNIDNFNIILKDPYENEDYIQPVDDHDLMHKSCRRGGGGGGGSAGAGGGYDDHRDDDNPESEEIVVEFFSNKSLIREGAELVRESIINLALNESKELIDQGIVVGGVEELDEELERMKIDLTNFRNQRERNNVTTTAAMTADSLSAARQGAAGRLLVDISNNNNNSSTIPSEDSDLVKVIRQQQQQQQMITKASQTELDKLGRHSIASSISSSGESDRSSGGKNVRNISNLTMNNCGGTINLKNVTNLTINACRDGDNSPVPAKSAVDSKPRCPSEEGSPECGFYKRLITENKILRQHILKTSLAANVPPQTNTTTDDSECSNTAPPADSSSTSSSTTTSVNNSSNSSSASDCPAPGKSKSQKLPLTAAELRAVLNLPQELGDLFAFAGSAVSTPGDTKESGTSNQQQQEHTMQIQQWLKQIISETETEPVQSAELLEFSRIND